MSKYDSPAIPEELLKSTDFFEELEGVIQSQARESEPHRNELRAILAAYNGSSLEIRDAIDGVFCWLTGYCLSSMAAIVDGARRKDPKDYADILEDWRKQERA